MFRQGGPGYGGGAGGAGGGGGGGAGGGTPGKRARTDGMRAAAATGTAGGGQALPHLDAIQRAFGRHDVSGISAHTGGAGGDAAAGMGAEAFAYGSRVAFADAPDLFTAAHEAAHVVQQRGGLQLPGGVGAPGDASERHADAVAERVVEGKSAEDLLDGVAAPGAAAPASPVVQHRLVPVAHPVSQDYFYDDRHRGQWFVREPDGRFTCMEDDRLYTYLPATDQFRDADGRYLDPETWRLFTPAFGGLYTHGGQTYSYTGGRYIPYLQLGAAAAAAAAPSPAAAAADSADATPMAMAMAITPPHRPADAPASGAASELPPLPPPMPWMPAAPTPAKKPAAPAATADAPSLGSAPSTPAPSALPPLPLPMPWMPAAPTPAKKPAAAAASADAPSPQQLLPPLPPLSPLFQIPVPTAAPLPPPPAKAPAAAADEWDVSSASDASEEGSGDEGSGDESDASSGPAAAAAAAPSTRRAKYAEGSKKKGRSTHFPNKLPPRVTGAGAISGYGGGSKAKYKRIKPKTERSGLPDSLTKALVAEARAAHAAGQPITPEALEMLGAGATLSGTGTQRNHVVAVENVNTFYASVMAVLTDPNAGPGARAKARANGEAVARGLTRDEKIVQEVIKALAEVESDEDSDTAAATASALGRKTADHRHNMGLGHGGKNMGLSNRTDPQSTPNRTHLVEKDADILDDLDGPFADQLGALGPKLLTVPTSPKGQHYMTSKTLMPATGAAAAAAAASPAAAPTAKKPSAGAGDGGGGAGGSA